MGKRKRIQPKVAAKRRRAGKVQRNIRYDLMELVSRVTPKNRHKLVDFGPPVGKEVW